MSREECPSDHPFSNSCSSGWWWTPLSHSDNLSSLVWWDIPSTLTAPANRDLRTTTCPNINPLLLIREPCDQERSIPEFSILVWTTPRVKDAHITSGSGSTIEEGSIRLQGFRYIKPFERCHSCDTANSHVRRLSFPNCDMVMGTCWQYVHVRVQFAKNWTGHDLLKFVQKQHIDHARFEGIALK